MIYGENLETLVCQVLEERDCIQGYISYVMKCLDFEKTYIIVHLRPNWNIQKFEIGDIGYLEYQYNQAGTEYFSANEYKTMKYKYSGVYVNNFIKITNYKQNEEIIL